MKVIFNIKKLQLSKITALSDAGLPTYGSPLTVPGTVSLSLDASSLSDPFYADGIGYYTPNGSATLSGTLENALIPTNVLEAIFAYLEDTNGNYIETDEDSSEFGMQFACDSDDGEVYFTIYRVKSTKPNINLQTNDPSANVNPQSLSLTASPITLTTGENIVKSFATKSASNYATYFTAITIPTIASV